MDNHACFEVKASKRHFLGMPPAQFLRDYWQKRPLLIRGAFPATLQPLQPEDLAGLACEPYALARLVAYDRKADRWSLRQGPFAERDFPDLPTRDWTLLVQDADKWDPDVRELLEPFSFLPSWRIDDVMVSFAAPGGSVGPHVDQYDVFLIQGLGNRRWQVGPSSGSPQTHRSDSELRILQRFEPSLDWIVEPGDMLYLPPGWPHFGEAVEACMTYSVGMRAPSLAEMLADLADHLGEHGNEAERYADPDLAPAAHPAEIDSASLQRLRSALTRAVDLDDATLAQWMGSLFSRYRASGDLAPPPTAPSRAQISQRLARGARLLRNPLTRMVCVPGDAGFRVYALGQPYELPTRLAQAVSEGDGIDHAMWQACDERDKQVLLSMAAEGHLVFNQRKAQP